MTQTTKAAGMAYDILAPTGCKDFDNKWREATKLIAAALDKAFGEGFEKGQTHDR